MEYACLVFNDSLPIYLEENLEKLQKRALRIIYPGLSYAEALFDAGVEYLFERRQFLTTKLFKEVLNDHNHKLYELLASTSFSEYILKKESTFNVPISKTNRFKNSYIINMMAQHITFNKAIKPIKI